MISICTRCGARFNPDGSMYTICKACRPAKPPNSKNSPTTEDIIRGCEKSKQNRLEIHTGGRTTGLECIDALLFIQNVDTQATRDFIRDFMKEDDQITKRILAICDLIDKAEQSSGLLDVLGAVKTYLERPQDSKFGNTEIIEYIAKTIAEGE